jgi:heme/copper-type cytochrome/quinol oxidase subunit 2
MNEARDQAIDAAISAGASKVTYGGAGASVLSWMLSNQAGVAVGILVAVIGLVVNLVFKIREDRRQVREHEARMRAIRGDYL